MAQALTCCLFIYNCIHYNQQTLRHLQERWVYLRSARDFFSALLGSSMHLSFFSLGWGKSEYVWKTGGYYQREQHRAATHTRTQARTTTVTQASEESNLCFGVLLWRSIEKEKQQCFIYSIFNSQSFIRRGIKKKHADFRNSLLRTWDLMRFEISMKSTSNLFKACSASISWQIFIAETIGRKHTGIYTFWDISPWRLVYQVVSEKS